jgi:chemotaxis protein MotB
MFGKKPNPPAGCPEYMLTYGDMMSLLLCFFVMLVSMSRIKEDADFRAAMESIRKAFGYTTAPSPVAGEYVETNAMTSLIQRIQDTIIQRNRRNKGELGEASAAQRGQIGKASTVRSIRDGIQITVGGLSLFEEGSDQLLPEAQEELKSLSELIAGYNNRILIRGHTSRVPLPTDSRFQDKMELTYARAAAVKAFLAANRIDERRMNVEACGDHEPVRMHSAATHGGQAPNHRVEIIVKDTMVEEAEGGNQQQTHSGRTG